MTTTAKMGAGRGKHRVGDCRQAFGGETATRQWFPTEETLNRFVDGVLERAEHLAREHTPRSSTVQPALFEQTKVQATSCRRVLPSIRQDVRSLVSHAFRAMFAGMPEDHVVANPEANREFVNRCRLLGAEVSEFALNRTLLNVRKAGLHKGLERGRAALLSREQIDQIGFAAEMGTRVVQLKTTQRLGVCVSIDHMLCDPELRRDFNVSATAVSPGHSEYEYCLAALAYRKSGRESTQRLGDTAAPSWRYTEPLLSLDVDAVPEAAGIYCVDAGSKTLFISATLNLRERLKAHKGTGEQVFALPEVLGARCQPLQVSWFLTPREWKPRRAEAVAWRMKVERQSLLNICCTAI